MDSCLPPLINSKKYKETEIARSIGLLYNIPVQFRWIDWNAEHATAHGCSITEIESVAASTGRGFPRQIGDEKRLVIGRGQGGGQLQVFYLLDDDVTVFVIHAMPLTTRRRRRSK